MLKLAVAYVLVFGMRNPSSPFPAIAANTVADGIAGLGAVIALSIPAVARLRWFSKPLLRKFFAYGVPLMGVSIAVALLNMIDRYLVTGFFGRDVFAVYNQNNSIASGIFTMISVGIMRGVYPNVLRAWREGGRQAAKPLLDPVSYTHLPRPPGCGAPSRCAPRSGYRTISGGQCTFP